MIDRTVEIGKIAKSTGIDLKFEELTLEDNKNRNNSKNDRYFVKEIIFSTDEENLSISEHQINLNNENRDNLVEQYYWRGNSERNNEKISLTSTDFKNVIEAIPNIKKRLDQEDNHNNEDEKKFAESIGFIFDKYYELEKNKNKGKYILKKEFTDNLGEKGKAKNVKLYSIKLGMKLLCEYEKYKKILDEELKPHKDGFTKGTCNVCGKLTEVTSDTTKLTFKYYITDKVSFSSNFQNNFEKNFAICEECYTDALMGEKFIVRNFKTYLGTQLIVIPHTVLPEHMKSPEVKNLFKVFKLTKLTIDGKYQDLFAFRNELIELKENKAIDFLVDLMFYRDKKGSFKIKHLIQDITIFNIERIYECLIKSEEAFNKLYNGPGLNLNTFYRLMSGYDSNKGLSYLIDIFKGSKISEEKLISDFMYSERSKLYQSIENKDKSRSDFILMAIFLYFLKLMQILKRNEYGEIKKMIDLENVEERKEMEVLKEMKVDEQREALIRLGFILSSVSTAQFNNNLRNSPILDKVNFNGMDLRAIRGLVIRLEEKMKQYNLFFQNNIIDLMKVNSIVIREMGRWNLSNEDNVFYVMVGYSLNRALHSRKEELEANDSVMETEEIY